MYPCAPIVRLVIFFIFGGGRGGVPKFYLRRGVNFSGGVSFLFSEFDSSPSNFFANHRGKASPMSGTRFTQWIAESSRQESQLRMQQERGEDDLGKFRSLLGLAPSFKYNTVSFTIKKSYNGCLVEMDSHSM